MSSQKFILLKYIFLTQDKLVKTEIKTKKPFVLYIKASLLENITDQVILLSLYFLLKLAQSYLMKCEATIWE